MPLRDHFHPPLSDLYPWESFHAAWATEIMRTLNRHVLPPGCFAAAQVMPAALPDNVEVQVFQRVGGAVLVAAIELVSPRNKDRPVARRAFVAKCASYLQQGIGLVVVDVITERQANLHNELIRFLEQPDRFELAEEASLYGVAYRPSRQETGDQIELWPTPLAVGQPLPNLPLALRGIATVPVDLEATYGTTCLDCRL